MTTVRISDLPEIRVDRLTNDDYLIVNDGDAITSKISMEQFVFGVAQSDIVFSGEITFSGDVTFNGNIDGNFYDKSQVYTKNEVDVLIAELNQYDRYQDERIFALVELSGIPENTTTYPNFTYSIVPNDSTTFSALQSLEKAISTDRNEMLLVDARIRALELLVASHSNEIADLKNNLSDTNDDIADRSVAFNTLGYTTTYIDDAGAISGGVVPGEIYVYSPNGQLEDGHLRVLA